MVRLRLKMLLPRTLRKRWKKVLRRLESPSRQGTGKSIRKARTAAAPAAPIDLGPARLLSAEPPLFLCGMPYHEYLGIAPAFAQRHGNMRCGFIVFPTWSIEDPVRAATISRMFFEHSARYPEHLFRFICNTPKETELLRDRGLPAHFINKNIFVSERVFRPLPESRVEFDAIYNARFVRLKRHELAAAIPRVGYLTYVESQGHQQQFRDLHAAAVLRNPGHALLNPLVDGMPVRLSREEVNAQLARGAVGLVLSEREGSSYAAMEYLLAGLPVVSTPSKGGREVFFDPGFCIVCPPDPASVRDAVAALRSRDIPRETIRASTLASMEPQRRQFLALVDDLLQQLGGRAVHAGAPWPFSDVSGVPWAPFDMHLAEFAAARQQLEVPLA